jgi:hypothetical protein
MTIEMPSSMTQTAAAVRSASNEMAGISGDACKLFGTIGSLLDDTTKAIVRAAEAAMHAVTSAIGAISKAISDAMTAVGGLIQLALSKLSDLGLSAIEAINAAISAIGSVMSSALSAVNSALGSVKSAIADIFSKLGNLIKGIGVGTCPGSAAVATNLGPGAGSVLGDAAKFAETGNMISTDAGLEAKVSSESAKNTAESAADQLSTVSDSMNENLESSISSLRTLVE